MEEEVVFVEENHNDSKPKIPKVILSAIIFLFLASIGGYYFFFSAPIYNAKVEQFIVPLSMKTDQALEKLQSSGFIKSPWAFSVALRLFDWRGTIDPGSYDLSKGENVFTIAKILNRPPHGVWVTIPEGLRKEEIAEVVGKAIGWEEKEKNDFIKIATNENKDYFEGVYFPDTYLISRNSTPKEIAKKLNSHFQEKFSQYSSEAIRKNVKWTTLIKVASLIQREGKSADDMAVISSVLWNRLDQGMKLQVDATVQYARGDVGGGWWAPITKSDITSIDSPYNTYIYKGLPPTPIANPGLTAINAALNPASTKCVYYIHDSSGLIHCSETYTGQQNNINKYLK